MALDPAQSYLPSLVTNRLLPPFSPDKRWVATAVPGTLLFLDIAGFTALAEAITRDGRGSGEVRDTINEYFDLLITHFLADGGDIVKFSGDAISVLWPSSEDGADRAADRALSSALRAQAELGDFRTKSGASLAMKITVITGSFEFILLSSATSGAFVLIGDPFMRLAEGAKAASSGTVLADSDTLQNATLPIVSQKITAAFSQVRSAGEVPVGWDLRSGHFASPLNHDLSKFLPKYLALSETGGSNGIWQESIRRLTCLFVHAGGAQTGEAIWSLWNELASAVGADDGALLEMMNDDKGLIFIFVFGIPPYVHEDDEFRATKVALRLRDYFQRLGIYAKFGIATGLAFTGTVGSQHRQFFTAIGEVLNVAARMMEADDGGISVEHTTRHAARHLLSFEERPQLNAKGKQSPLRRYKPLAEIAASSNPEQVFGRSQEALGVMNFLKAKQHGICVVEGEPGIGKSTLIDEILKDLARNGVSIISVQGSYLERSVPFSIWRAAISQLADVLKADRETLVFEFASSRKLDENSKTLLRSALGLAYDEHSLDEHLPPAARANRSESLLTDLISCLLTETKTSLIAIEDLHWVDSASVKVLSSLSEASSAAILATVRPASGDSLPELKDLIIARGSRFQLGPLSYDAVCQLACGAVRANEISPRLGEVLFSRSGGHPYFANEIIGFLLEQDLIAIERGRATLKAGAEDRAKLLPNSLEGVIATRIARLPSQSELALKVASAIGRDFRKNALLSVYPQNKLIEDLDNTLTRLTQEQLVLFEQASEDVMFSFKHVLVQEVAYELLVPSQRRALHASIAQWYEIVFRGDLRPLYPLLAHHWSKAEENKRAIIYFERAADQALRAGAYREALHFLSQALLIADPSETPGFQRTVPLRQARWRRQLAEAHLALGNPRQGRVEVETALALLGEPVPSSEAGKSVALASGLSGFLFRSLGRKPRDTNARPADPVKQECLKCYYVLLWVMFFYKDPKVMVILTLRSLRDALNLGSAVDIAAFCSISMLLAGLIPLHGLARYIGALGATYAEASNHSFARLVVQETQGVYAMGLGRWDEAEAKLTASVKLAEQLGDKRRWIESNCVISTFLHCKGRFEERIKLAREIYRVAKHTGDIQAELWALLDEVESLLPLQRFEKAAKNLDSADEIYSRGVGSAEEIWYLGLRTFVEYQMGRYQSAKAFLARALDAMAQSSPSAFYTLDGYSNAAIVAIHLYDRENPESVRAAKTAIKQVARYSRVFPIRRARHRFLEAILAMRLGHVAKAAKEMDAAERLALSSGMTIDGILIAQFRDQTGAGASRG